MTTEMTDQGEQIVLPGAERSALQAAKARGEKLVRKAIEKGSSAVEAFEKYGIM